MFVGNRLCEQAECWHIQGCLVNVFWCSERVCSSSLQLSLASFFKACASVLLVLSCVNVCIALVLYLLQYACWRFSLFTCFWCLVCCSCLFVQVWMRGVVIFFPKENAARLKYHVCVEAAGTRYFFHLKSTLSYYHNHYGIVLCLF